MKQVTHSLDGLFSLIPESFSDERGSFNRSFCLDVLKQYNINFQVCQCNISRNPHQYTLRGFHYQKQPAAEQKLLTCITGDIYNVVLDLRPDSPTYLCHDSILLSESTKAVLYVPAGCANAFLTTTPDVIVHYYMGNYYNPGLYRGIRFDDSFFNIPWPHPPLHISEKDRNLPDFILT